MPRIQSQIQTNSSEFKKNLEYHSALQNQLLETRSKIISGGEPEAHQRHKKQGKLFARDRIAQLLDPGSPFLEVGTYAAHEVYPDYVPAAGMVCGVGLIHGRQCMIVANDATVKGGTYYPLTVKKHLRAQEIALENGLPCVYLVDSGGAFLPLQADVFPDKEHFGRIFYNQAHLSAAGIPQISAVMGSCTAGGAYVPAMSDQTVIVRNTGTIFLGGPPLVKAATGEDVSAEDLGGARVHTEMSGVADYFAENDDHALMIVRELVSHLGHREGAQVHLRSAEKPVYDPQEMLGIFPRDLRVQIDIREIIARIVDGSFFFEFKERYAPTLVCGFSHIEGMPCGIIANNGVLFGESALKAAHFIELCTSERVPLLFLQNIMGFMVGAQVERAGIAKDGAKMVHAVATANIPKIGLILGGSFGAGNYGMCGRAYAPRFLWSWPCSRISVMGGEQAAQVLVTIRKDKLTKEGRAFTREEEAAIADPIRQKFEKEGHPLYASARLWDDGVISYADTRNILAMSLAASLNAPLKPTKVGVFRM